MRSIIFNLFVLKALEYMKHLGIIMTFFNLCFLYQELIDMIIQLQSNLRDETKQKAELEEYLDRLLLRVMETSPKILQTPYICYSHNSRLL